MYIFLGFPLLLLASYVKASDESQPPHIVIIYADDLGWNDVSFHGSPQVPTPNIDALAWNGIVMNSYYGEWLCTPSRGALFTGKYPMRLGLQHGVIKAAEPTGLPLNETILPQYLKTLGYKTHMVGKWHLGYSTFDYLPLHRGFDTFMGYWNGLIGYYDYTTWEREEDELNYNGIDLHEGDQAIRHFRGEYATRVFTKRARDVIMDHDTSKPLFLYLAELAAHSGNLYQPGEAPPETTKKFMYIDDVQRRVHAGILSELDTSVGGVFEALHERDMLRNTIFLFIADNGGDANSNHGGYGNNFPLRGNKATYWEGGVHIPAVIWSPLLELQKPRISKQLMHASDWLPTLFTVAGGNVSDLGEIDGHNMWEAILDDLPSPRKELLHNLDPIFAVSAYRRGDFKVVNGSTGPGEYNEWYETLGTGESNQTYDYDLAEWIFKDGSVVGEILRETDMWIAGNMSEYYLEAQIICQKPPPKEAYSCDPTQKPCLFNITADPCEYYNLAEDYPEDVTEMMNRIHEFAMQAVPPQTKPNDRRGDPMCHNFTYVPWLEPEYYTECTYADK